MTRKDALSAVCKVKEWKIDLSLLTVFQSSVETVNRGMVTHHIVRNMWYGAPRSERDMVRRRDCFAAWNG